jgi:hypothetical protein
MSERADGSHKEKAMNTPNYKLQAMIDNQKSWPFIGNAYTTTTGAVRIVLDRGVKLELADGTKLEGVVKLYLREAFRRAEASPTATEPQDTQSSDV